MLDQPDAAECLEAEHQLACHRRNAVVVEATLPAVGKCQATALTNQRAGVAFDLPQALAEPHRDQLQRATSEGVPVDGYFPRSAQDKFEWMDGFGNRFGTDLRRLRHPGADPKAQRRIVPGSGTAERGRCEPQRNHAVR